MALTAIGVVARDIAIAKMIVAWPAPGSPSRTGLFGTSVYVRGALTLYALRKSVGDQTFFAILRTYIKRFAGGTASTSDFITVATEQSHKNMTSLLRSWLYDRSLPPLP